MSAAQVGTRAGQETGRDAELANRLPGHGDVTERIGSWLQPFAQRFESAHHLLAHKAQSGRARDS